MKHSGSLPSEDVSGQQAATSCVCAAPIPAPVVTPVAVQKDHHTAGPVVPVAVISATPHITETSGSVIAWAQASPPTFGRLRLHALFDVWQI
jgi:hypothetical protein